MLATIKRIRVRVAGARTGVQGRRNRGGASFRGAVPRLSDRRPAETRTWWIDGCRDVRDAVEVGA